MITYNRDQPFATDGIEVVLFKDGGSTDVTGSGTTYWFNNAEIKDGDKAVTASYGMKEIEVKYSSYITRFFIAVPAAAGFPSGIVVTKPPAKTEYKRGDAFLTAGMEIKLFESGWITDVTAGDASYSWTARTLNLTTPVWEQQAARKQSPPNTAATARNFPLPLTST